MIRTFIQVLSLAFTFEAALFLAKGGLGLSARSIIELSTPKWDISPEILANLAHQRVDTWIGVSFLLAAFALQMANTLWPMRWSDFEVHRGAAVYAVVLSVVVSFGAYFAGRSVAENITTDLLAAHEAQRESAEQEQSPE